MNDFGINRLIDSLYSWDLQTVYLSRFSMSNGYLVSRCITVGMRSFSSSRRHNGWLAASYNNVNSTLLSVCINTHLYMLR